MNVQNLKALLQKDSSGYSKKVIVVADNTEFEITGVSSSVDKITLNTKKVDTIHVGDSIENQTERTEQELKEEK